MDDLERDTVDFTDNYDGKYREPLVLPSRFPNLLVNGSDGIAVGMATDIPPQNLGEICDAGIMILDNPDVSIPEIMEVLPGPDFPTGGIICGRQGIVEGYMTGRGKVTLRARAVIVEEGNKAQIIIKEILTSKPEIAWQRRLLIWFATKRLPVFLVSVMRAACAWANLFAW